MGISLDSKKGTYKVSFSKRHPISRIPMTLRREGIKSKREAERVHRELVIRIEEQLKKTVVPDWKSAVDEFYRYSQSRGITEKTLESYMYCLKAHTLEAWGSLCVDEITSTMIRELIKESVGSKSIHQQKNLLKYIRAVFKMCVEKAFVNRDPSPLIKFPRADKIKNGLTEPEIAKLLNQAKVMDCEWYSIWATALYTGMRNGELYALRWDKVNLEEKTILVDSAWNNKDGFKCTKSGSDRIVHIAPPLMKILLDLKMSRHDPEFVLPRIHRWKTGEQARELRMFLAGLGLPQIRFHDLRATWATTMLSKGVEPIKVMKLGGWSDMKTMMIYIRKAGIDIRGSTDCLDLHNPFTEAAKVFGIRDTLQASGDRSAFCSEVVVCS